VGEEDKADGHENEALSATGDAQLLL